MLSEEGRERKRRIMVERNTKHGAYGTRTYQTWRGMIERCTSKKHKNYDRYGGRGITFCERWREYQNFVDDMGERPDGRNLDRINNDGPYCKENCRWVTQSEQVSNTSRNVLLSYNGKLMTMKQWAAEIGIAYDTLRHRIQRLHWAIDKALSTPPRKIRRSK